MASQLGRCCAMSGIHKLKGGGAGGYPTGQPLSQNTRASTTTHAARAPLLRPPAKQHTARKVVDTLREATADGRATVSFEFFPPKAGTARDAQAENLLRRVAQMGSLLRPLFVALTWRSDFTAQTYKPLWLDLGSRIQSSTGLDVMLHLTCHLPRDELEAVLAAARCAGIRNILALRGDAPVQQLPANNGASSSSSSSAARGHRLARRWMPPLGGGGGFKHAVELVALIRQLHGDWFCIAVGAYPEVHVEAWNSPDLPPSDQARLADIGHLRAKQDAGADLIITQVRGTVQSASKCPCSGCGGDVADSCTD